MSKLLPHHERVLIALDGCTEPYGEFCANFKRIAQVANLEDIPEVRRIVRALARKGFAEFWRGLVTDDGDFAGAGYCITPAGRALVATHPSGGNRHGE
ncbi:hypothetical protein [Brucella intermedia]|uniref:hypothetical protein n=1 Tax=Brucella intermedia TaxID=94625 RepID=UPI00244A7807|nr:hypothetical protein [Brucella intermedia]WGG61901.1 hypothetical protein QA414_15390 [Brucella intermedia]